MHRTRIAILFALLLVFKTEMMSQTKAGESTGTVVGSVLDQQGAVIVLPKPVIVFKGTDTVKEVTIDENGRFETTLPSGTYYVTADIPGFYPFRRAPFRVIAGSSTMINLVPSRRYLVRGTSVSSKVSPDEPGPRPKYESFRVTPRSKVTGLIQFELSHTAGRNVKYRPAIFTYDHITVHADELVFDRKSLRLTASGKRVILEDGKQRIEVNGVAVSFSNGEPQVDVIRE